VTDIFVGKRTMVSFRQVDYE